MQYFVIGEDKSLKPADADALVLQGGFMEGDIGFRGASGDIYIIRFIRGDSTGDGIAIGQNGIVVIGAGESVNLYTPAAGGGNTEKLILASDTQIEFYTNAQNGAGSAKKVTMDNGLLSGHQKAITSGTAAPSGGSNGDIYIQY